MNKEIKLTITTDAREETEIKTDIDGMEVRRKIRSNTQTIEVEGLSEESVRDTLGIKLQICFPDDQGKGNLPKKQG